MSWLLMTLTGRHSAKSLFSSGAVVLRRVEAPMTRMCLSRSLEGGYPEIYESYHLHKCNVASEIQPQLMQFPLNEPSIEAAMIGINALEKTIKYYA